MSSFAHKDAVAFRQMTDEQFLLQCRWEAFRGSGPGGQKRNKTSSAVRITHLPTGVAVAAEESRSQAENRSRALRRLRHRIVMEFRSPVRVDEFVAPGWFSAGRLGISVKSDLYLLTMGLALDVLAACEWSVADAARLLGVSTANLVKFLEADVGLWGHVNQMRRAAGLTVLKARR